jgi:hypothetical protein
MLKGGLPPREVYWDEEPIRAEYLVRLLAFEQEALLPFSLRPFWVREGLIARDTAKS